MSCRTSCHAGADERAVGPDRNEPNTAAATVFSKEQYRALYTALHAALVARGLHDQIGLVGGDLVENNEGTAGGHRAWFEYMVTNMNDVIDAWSETSTGTTGTTPHGGAPQGRGVSRSA